MTSRFTRFLRLGVLLATPLAMIACGDQTANDAPIIDTVEAPLVVSEQNGFYRIPVTVLFHDNDGEAVTRLRYRLPPNVDGMIDVPEPNPTRESTVVTIVIAASDLDGDENTTLGNRGKDGDHRGGGRHRERSLQLSIVDGRGAESRPSSSTVTLD